MKLVGVKKEGGWLFSEWALTYLVGWNSILNAAELIWQYMKEPEILTDDAPLRIGSAEEVRSIEESRCLTIRGGSEILGVPLMITFFNQLDLVRATVACASEEFMEADYRRFNLSMCQFMDSAELAMYR